MGCCATQQRIPSHATMAAPASRPPMDWSSSSDDEEAAVEVRPHRPRRSNIFDPVIRPLDALFRWAPTYVRVETIHQRRLMLEQMAIRLYLYRFKPRLLDDPYTPWRLLTLGHGAADFLFEQFMIELDRVTDEQIYNEQAAQDAAEEQAVAAITQALRRFVLLRRQAAQRSKRAWSPAQVLLRSFRRCRKAIRTVVLAARAYLLYSYAPYDRGFFGKISRASSLLLLTVGYWPVWYVRGVYYTVVLLCLLPDDDEYQYVLLISKLKATQCVTGVYQAMKAVFSLWSCTAVFPGTCAASGPGVDGVDVTREMSVVLWLQLIMAFVSSRVLTPPENAYRPLPLGRHNAPRKVFRLVASAVLQRFVELASFRAFEARMASARRAARDDGNGGDAEAPQEDQPGDMTFGHGDRLLTHSHANLTLLLAYDALAFVACALFFCAAMLYSGSQASPQIHLFSAELWLSWRADMTYILARILFALSSFPFFPFLFLTFRKLLTHKAPTGYTRGGLCVTLQEDGLSALVSWTRHVLSINNVRKSVPQKQLVSIRRRLVAAERLLAADPVEKKLHNRHRVRLEASLSKAFTPNHPHERLVFPVRVLVRQLAARLNRNDILHKVQRDMYEAYQEGVAQDVRAAHAGVVEPILKFRTYVAANQLF